MNKKFTAFAMAAAMIAALAVPAFADDAEATPTPNPYSGIYGPATPSQTITIDPGPSIPVGPTISYVIPEEVLEPSSPAETTATPHNEWAYSFARTSYASSSSTNYGIVRRGYIEHGNNAAAVAEALEEGVITPEVADDASRVGPKCVVYQVQKDDTAEVNIYNITADNTEDYYLKVTPVDQTLDAETEIETNNPDLTYDEMLDIWSETSGLNYYDDYKLNFLYDLMVAAGDNEPFMNALAPENEVVDQFTPLAEEKIAEVDPDGEQELTIEDFDPVGMYELTPSANLEQYLEDNEAAFVGVPIDEIDGVEEGDQLLILQVKGYNKLADGATEYDAQNFDELEDILAEGIDQLDLDCDVAVISDYSIYTTTVGDEDITTVSFDTRTFGQIVIYKLIAETDTVTE